MSEMFDFKNYQWRKMANNGEKWRKMAMANLPFPFVKFAISPLPPPPHFSSAGGSEGSSTNKAVRLNCYMSECPWSLEELTKVETSFELWHADIICGLGKLQRKELLINRNDPSDPPALKRGQMRFFNIKASDPPDPPYLIIIYFKGQS